MISWQAYLNSWPLKNKVKTNEKNREARMDQWWVCFPPTGLVWGFIPAPDITCRLILWQAKSFAKDFPPGFQFYCLQEKLALQIIIKSEKRWTKNHPGKVAYLKFFFLFHLSIYSPVQLLQPVIFKALFVNKSTSFSSKWHIYNQIMHNLIPKFYEDFWSSYNHDGITRRLLHLPSHLL